MGILVRIALFSSLSRRGLGTRIEGLWRQDFRFLHSMTSGPRACNRDVSLNCMGLKMRAVVTDEAHLVVQWEVFDICLELFTSAIVLNRDL